MVSRWFKTKNIDIKKRLTLRSLCAGCVFFGFLFAFTKIFSLSLCPIKRLTGISCFGCGLTRGFISILKLDFKSACKYNILSVPLFICIALYFFCALADVFLGKNYIAAIEKQLSKKYMFPLYAAILIAATAINNIY